MFANSVLIFMHWNFSHFNLSQVIGHWQYGNFLSISAYNVIKFYLSDFSTFNLFGKIISTLGSIEHAAVKFPRLWKSNSKNSMNCSFRFLVFWRNILRSNWWNCIKGNKPSYTLSIFDILTLEISRVEFYFAGDKQ